MRSSEEMGYAIYLAMCKRNKLEPLDWDRLREREQGLCVATANAALEYLFEHGRISAYLNAKQLEAFGIEYRAYLAEKSRS